MRRLPILLLLFVFGAALAGCTLSRREETIIVTATLSGPLVIPVTDTPAAPTLAAVVSTDSPTPPPDALTLAPTATDEPSPAPAFSTDTPVLTPSATPTPAPTRTVLRPPTVLPLDDGSGRAVPDTGNSPAMFRPVPEVEALPETLYFLSEQAGLAQVWRLRYGLSYPDQLSLSPAGVAAFDVAPDGKLAYITPNGEMVIDGLPFLPPNASDGSLPRVTALAWSPSGDWLAYVLSTPGADSPQAAGQGIDGVWIRNREGQTVLLAASDYTPGESFRRFTGPIDWHPGGQEFLIKYEREGGSAYSRINIVTAALAPVWNASTLPPGSFETARWSVNGNAIITSGAHEALRVEPATLGIQTLVSADENLWIEDAQQFANGTVTFVGAPRSGTGSSGPWRLYLYPPGAASPQALTDDLTTEGTVEFLWDDFGEQALIVTYAAPGALMGTAILRDSNGALHNLTPLTGPVGAPQWGPHVKPGDWVRVRATQGESLNLRSDPAGQILVQLANGARLTVLGGPRLFDGLRWWRVRTTDGIAGWAAESIPDSGGRRQWTLLPDG